MKKKIYSTKTLGGTTVHTDEQGNTLGSSYDNGSGTIIHFDANGKRIGSSQKIELFGAEHVNHYDNNGKLVGQSADVLFGTNHYDTKGNMVGNSGGALTSVDVPEKTKPLGSYTPPTNYTAPQKNNGEAGPVQPNPVGNSREDIIDRIGIILFFILGVIFAVWYDSL